MGLRSGGVCAVRIPEERCRGCAKGRNVPICSPTLPAASAARAKSLDLFVRTAELLEVPLDALAGVAGGKAVELRRKEPQVVERWRRLSDEQRRALMAVLRSVVG